MQPKTIDFSKYHSIRGAAKFCDVSPSAIRNWILTERVPATKANGRWMIHESDLQKVIDERQALAEVAETFGGS